MNGRTLRRTLAGIAATTAAGGTAVAAMIAGGTTMTPAAGKDDKQQIALTDPQCEVSTGPPIASLDAVQSRNVRAIYAASTSSRLGSRGAVVGVATAMQESQLRVLASRANPESLRYPHDGVAAGDHDSVGLFQQRDAWGPMPTRMQAVASATMFYTGGRAGQRGLADVADWQTMPVWQAAQAVQVSAYPTAYEQWTALAVSAVRAVETGRPVAVAGCSSSVLPGAGAWRLPVQPGRYRLSSGFGPRTSPGGIGSTNHQGLDFAAPTGTDVHAAAAGTVRLAGPSRGFGNLVTIDHGGGIVTYYAHLSKVLVAVGQRVSLGHQVGRVGSTGNSTGPHLHFQVVRDDQPIDPQPWLTQHGARP